MKGNMFILLFMIAINSLKALPLSFNTGSTKCGLGNGYFINAALP